MEPSLGERIIVMAAEYAFSGAMIYYMARTYLKDRKETAEVVAAAKNARSELEQKLASELDDVYKLEKEGVQAESKRIDLQRALAMMQDKKGLSGKQYRVKLDELSQICNRWGIVLLD